PDEWVDVPSWAVEPLPAPAGPVALVPPASAGAEHGQSMGSGSPRPTAPTPPEQGTRVPTKPAPEETQKGFISGAVTSPRAQAPLTEPERALLNRTLAVALCYVEKHSNLKTTSYLEHVRIVEQVKTTVSE